jgi:flagellar FliL protein
MGAAATTADGAGAEIAKPGGRKKLIVLAIPVLLAAIGAGLWFGGILPPLLGMDPGPAAHGAAVPGAAVPGVAGHGATAAGQGGKPGGAAPAAAAPTYLEMPEIVANLNAGPRRASYIKLHSRLELAHPEDADAVKAAMPRLLDMFQTYLREMRPEELSGSTGTYRLREELIARANIALAPAPAPARVVDVLFTEMLIQ